MMQRTTIMLPRPLKERAARRAKEMGISLGELIREWLARGLEAHSGGGGGDPFLVDEAVFHGDLRDDVAERHDAYLYGDAE